MIVPGGEDQSGEPGEYEQKSIRYTGRNIPSRSFRILQSMTGGDASGSPGNVIYLFTVCFKCIRQMTPTSVVQEVWNLRDRIRVWDSQL